MKASIESTSKIVTLVVKGVDVPARIWTGMTEHGVPFHCYITRVAVDKDGDTRQFDRELEEHAAPTTELQAIPLRLII